MHDVQVLADLHVRSWQQAYRGKVPQRYLDGLDAAQREPIWRRSLADPGPGVTLVAEDESRGVAGFIRVAPSRDAGTDPEVVGEVQALYVLAEWWGHGVGRLLMEAGLSRLAQAGHRESILWVLASNDRARRFYEAGGWRPDGATKTDDSRGFPLFEVRYRRAVAPPSSTAP